MMLRYLAWTKAADAIISAMDAAIASNNVTYNFTRSMEGTNEVKCSEFTDVKISNL